MRLPRSSKYDLVKCNVLMYVWLMMRMLLMVLAVRLIAKISLCDRTTFPRRSTKGLQGCLRYIGQKCHLTRNCTENSPSALKMSAENRSKCFSQQLRIGSPLFSQ